MSQSKTPQCPHCNDTGLTKGLFLTGTWTKPCRYCDKFNSTGNVLKKFYYNLIVEKLTIWWLYGKIRGFDAKWVQQHRNICCISDGFLMGLIITMVINKYNLYFLLHEPSFFWLCVLYGCVDVFYLNFPIIRIIRGMVSLPKEILILGGF